MPASALSPGMPSFLWLAPVLLDVLGQLELRDFRGHEFCTEVVGVVTHFHGQIHAGDARKARIVVNLIGIDDLAAAHEVLFDNDK